MNKVLKRRILVKFIVGLLPKRRSRKDGEKTKAK